MADDQPQDHAPLQDPLLDDDAAGRQVAFITGMSAEAAATFAHFHSGRFAHRAAFRDAA